MNGWAFRLVLLTIVAFTAGWGLGARHHAAASSEQLAALQRFLVIQSMPSGDSSPSQRGLAMPPGASRTLPPGHPAVPGLEASPPDAAECPYQDWARRHEGPSQLPREVVQAPRTPPQVITT